MMTTAFEILRRECGNDPLLMDSNSKELIVLTITNPKLKSEILDLIENVYKDIISVKSINVGDELFFINYINVVNSTSLSRSRIINSYEVLEIKANYLILDTRGSLPIFRHFVNRCVLETNKDGTLFLKHGCFKLSLTDEVEKLQYYIDLYNTVYRISKELSFSTDDHQIQTLTSLKEIKLADIVIRQDDNPDEVRIQDLVEEED